MGKTDGSKKEELFEFIHDCRTHAIQLYRVGELNMDECMERVAFLNRIAKKASED